MYGKSHIIKSFTLSKAPPAISNKHIITTFTQNSPRHHIGTFIGTFIGIFYVLRSCTLLLAAYKISIFSAPERKLYQSSY